VHALRIDFGDFRILFFVAELAPNSNVKRTRHKNFLFNYVSLPSWINRDKLHLSAERFA
jgi:hypothetical protein